MTDQQQIEALHDWLAVRRIWTQTAQKVASEAATDALDDFLKEHKHVSPATDKTKE
jgi:hypothetical protein